MEEAEVSGDGRRDGQWAIKISGRKNPFECAPTWAHRRAQLRVDP